MRFPKEDVKAKAKAVRNAVKTFIWRTKKVNDSVRDTTVAAVDTIRDGADAVVGSVKYGVEATGRFIYDCIDVVIGICFILLGIAPYYTVYILGLGDGMIWQDYACSVVDVLGGLIMIFNPRRTCNRSIGVYAMVIGSTNLLGSMEDLLTIGDNLFSDLFFVYGLVISILSLNLMASGVSYLRDRPRGTNGMMFRTLMLMILTLADLYLMIQIGDYESIGEMLRNIPDEFINAFMLFLFLVVMDTKEARESNWIERFAVSMGAFRRMTSTDRKSSISRTEADILCDETRSAWTPIDDGGPAESECRLTIRGIHGDAYMIVQKWRGRDGLFVTIADHPEGTMITATRLKINSVALEGDPTHLLFKGDDHFHLVMSVKSDSEQDAIRERAP